MSSLLLASLASLSACGDDSAPAGDGGGGDGGADARPDAMVPAPTLADVCDASDGLFVTFYRKIFSCYPEFGVFLGEEPTASQISDACEGSLQPYLDDGTLMLGSAQDFAACRDYLDGVDCDSLNDEADTPCDAVFVGTLDVGEDCDGNEQCVGDAYCDTAGSGTCGVCRDEKSNDTTCQEDFECASNFCHPTSGTCETRALLDDACTSKDDCGGTRVCSAATDSCVDEPAWAVGTPCRDFIDCDVTQSGLYCDQGTGQCRAFLPVSSPCSDTTALCNLLRYEHCGEAVPGSGTFTCLAPTTVGENMECNFGLGTQCSTGLVCRDTDESDATPSICVRLRNLSEACNETNQPCHLFLECVGGACQYGTYTGECPAP